MAMVMITSSDFFFLFLSNVMVMSGLFWCGSRADNNGISDTRGAWRVDPRKHQKLKRMNDFNKVS